MTRFTWYPATRAGRALALACLAACLLAGAAFWKRTSVDPSLVAVVRRGPLTATLTVSGTLRPIQALTYRSPIAGREVEITEIAPEGTRVREGDLVARLDTSELQRELERADQERRQAGLDLQVAEGESEEAQAAVKAVTEGEGALTVAEARSRVQLSERKVARTREDYEQLKPLLEKGFVTRAELGKISDELDQALEELTLARKRAEIATQMTHPRETRRAALQLAQKGSQLGQAHTRVAETQARVDLLRQLIEDCSIYAQRPGLVVYEENQSAFPRRKMRVGDRVTASQGIVTIPEVGRMQVEASVTEASVHRVRQGQAATIRIEAFPDLRLTGRVSRIGTLATASNGSLDDKRFGLVVEVDSSEADLRPEMTVRADIVVGKKDGVLLVPVTAVFEEQGSYVVSVLGPTGPEVRRVELGESNDQVVEIVAGLDDNDRVTLVAPATPAASSSGRPDARAIQPR